MDEASSFSASSSSSSSVRHDRPLVRASSSSDLGTEHLSLSVAFQSLLHLLCSFYEGEPARRERLFQGEIIVNRDVVARDWLKKMYDESGTRCSPSKTFGMPAWRPCGDHKVPGAI